MRNRIRALEAAARKQRAKAEAKAPPRKPSLFDDPDWHEKYRQDYAAAVAEIGHEALTAMWLEAFEKDLPSLPNQPPEKPAGDSNES